MYRFWDIIIRAAFDILKPKTIVEIGTDKGDCTRKILQYCERESATLHSIDVADNAWRGPHPNLVAHHDLSLNALYAIPSFDAVLIDGDHNWYTVINELRIIGKKAAETGIFPVVFVHDIGWPYARRDLYHNPETIPANFRHPYKQGGLVPGQAGLQEGGGMNLAMYHGIYENNIQSGVLTAVEDFIKEYDMPLHLVKVPGLFGLGVLLSKQQYEQNHALRALLDEVSTPASIVNLLNAIEEERLRTSDQLRVAYEECKQLKEERDRLLQQKPTQQEVPEELQVAYENLERNHQILQFNNAQTIAVKDALQTEVRELTQQNTHLKTMLNAMHNTLTTEQSDAAKTRQQSVQSDHQMQALKLNLETKQAEIELLNKRLRGANNMLSTYENTIQELRLAGRTNRELYERVTRSTSWKLTHPLRVLGATAKSIRSFSFMYVLFSGLHDLWTDFGEPCPRLVRFVRHRVLGKAWPAKDDGTQKFDADNEPVAKPTITPDTPKDVCIVITTYNQAKELPQTIESVLRQTRMPKEILIIDDDSSDETQQLAITYAPKGVEYLKGAWHNVNAARNAGLRSTTSPLLVFLQAGDRIPPEYLQSCHDTITQDINLGIAYTEYLKPGTSTTRGAKIPDTFDPVIFEQENFFANASMVRRSALQRVGGWNHGLREHAEWITWRRILSEGFGAAKSVSTCIQSDKEVSVSSPFEAVLCLSLSGRTWMWPKTAAFLEAQTVAHASVHLVILDTSQDDQFHETVRRWSETCDYGKVTLLKRTVGMKELAQADRSAHKQAVAAACSEIYGAFASYCDAPWALLLEDDVEPPANAFEQLMNHYRDGVVSIAALCYKRGDASLPIAWYWDSDGMPRDIAPQQGVTSVGGNGFCCTAVRGTDMRSHRFRFGPEDFCHDHNFYADTVRDGDGVALLDWNCVCKHYLNPQEWH